MEAMNQIRLAVPDASLEFVPLDLSDFESVRACAAAVKQKHARLDVLLNNAGMTNMRYEENDNGHEMTFVTNHLGPFLLTNLLLESVANAKGRIINVASDAHKIGNVFWDDLSCKKNYWVMKSYAQSKLCNILFTRALAKRVADKNIKVNCLHPGGVATNIWPEKNWWEKLMTKVIRVFLITEEEGARTSIWLASNEVGGKSTGKYYYKCKEHKISKRAADDNAAERLWSISEKMTGLNP
jgi:NAD(P)-dependent dehydrogenase (short-subunit alcohol dehydrogenase family)